MSWTENKVKTLKDLWGKGKTASQIAEIIGGVSRNAVIGKAHRLDLSAKIKTRSSIKNSKYKSIDNLTDSIKTRRGRKFKISVRRWTNNHWSNYNCNVIFDSN